MREQRPTAQRAAKVLSSHFGGDDSQPVEFRSLAEYLRVRAQPAVPIIRPHRL